MGLKNAQIANFLNDEGKTDALLTLKIREVRFRYEDLQVEIEFRAVPANWQPGMKDQFIKQTFPIDLTDADILALVLSNSDKIWEICPDVPFIPVYESETQKIVQKSINDLGGVVVDA